MLHWSIVTHAKTRKNAQGFGLELCQLALTRIPRQVSRASLESSSRNTRDASLDKRAKNAKAFLNERTKNNKRHSKTEYHGIRYRY